MPIQIADLPESFRRNLIPAGKEPGTGKERYIPFNEGGAQGSAYNPTKEEIEELGLRQRLAKQGGTLPKNMLDMTAAERLEVLRRIAQAGPATSSQFKRETSPFGNVMRLGF